MTMVKRSSADEIRRQPEYQYISSGTPVPRGILLQTSKSYVSLSDKKLENPPELDHLRMTRSFPTNSVGFVCSANAVSLAGSRLGRSFMELKRQTRPEKSNKTTSACGNVTSQPPSDCTAEPVHYVAVPNKVGNEFVQVDGTVQNENTVPGQYSTPKDCIKVSVMNKVQKKEIRFNENCLHTHQDQTLMDKDVNDTNTDEMEKSLIVDLSSLSLGSRSPINNSDNNNSTHLCCGNTERGDVRDQKFADDPMDHHNEEQSVKLIDGNPTGTFLKTILQDTTTSRESMSRHTNSCKRQKGIVKAEKRPRSSHSMTILGHSEVINTQHDTSTTRENSDVVSAQTSAHHRHHQPHLERSQSKYDAKVEKSSTYLHASSRIFTRASQYMVTNGRGLSQLNVHYSQTNTGHNDRIIFTDLLKAAHVKNAVVGDNVYTVERRLYKKRQDPARATTFYDRFECHTSRYMRHKSSSAPARSVADRKRERKKRIRRRNEEIELGYTPRAWSITPVGEEDIEHMLATCRYLRVDVRRQPKLFGYLERGVKENSTETLTMIA